MTTPSKSSAHVRSGRRERRPCRRSDGRTRLGKELIGQILAMEPSDDLFDAKVKVLFEQIEHHVREQEGEMFPKANAAKLDLAVFGEAIEGRNAEIELPVAR